MFRTNKNNVLLRNDGVKCWDDMCVIQRVIYRHAVHCNLTELIHISLSQLNMCCSETKLFVGKMCHDMSCHVLAHAARSGVKRRQPKCRNQHSMSFSKIDMSSRCVLEYRDRHMFVAWLPVMYHQQFNSIQFNSIVYSDSVFVVYMLNNSKTQQTHIFPSLFN